MTALSFIITSLLSHVCMYQKLSALHKDNQQAQARLEEVQKDTEQLLEVLLEVGKATVEISDYQKQHMQVSGLQSRAIAEIYKSYFNIK